MTTRQMGVFQQPAKDPRIAFVDEAEEFAERHRSKFIFRALRFYTRCAEDELDFLIKKIYASSIASSQRVHEGAAKTHLGVLLLPFHLIASKKLFWRREAATRYSVDTPDEEYFWTRYAVIYGRLAGTKRVTPRYRGNINGFYTTEPADASMSRRSLLLFLICPFAWIALHIFRLTSGLDIMRAYRNALNIYAAFDGYFKRYPCERFVTYADDSNHPARYIAFRQNGGKRLIAVQNGERGYHPSWAFGMVDAYFVFGRFYADLLKPMRYHARSIYPAGSLSLNLHYERLKGVHLGEYDIVYIDNGTLAPPHYGGLAPDVAVSEEITLSYLNRFKTRHKGLRIAYQLRPYGDDRGRKDAVLSILKKHFSESIEILENSGAGESYANVRAARLAINFQSTMGFEALRMRVPTLFVNYSGRANESLCEDGRFQLDSADKGYEAFERKVEGLLDMKLDGPPEAALARHAAFDGRVQERIAGVINGWDNV
ncbi:MAG: hypothetical protein HY894_09720 [Deltaproteobacteria bacterium]|nr:hypothetical protein [Deltaproteobacteria bacterium]